MAVGAGSIKRASKISKDAAGDESVQKVEKEVAASKRTERTKKSTEQNSVTTNKRKQKNIKNNTQVLQNTANKVYHITEELPIYLL